MKRPPSKNESSEKGPDARRPASEARGVLECTSRVARCRATTQMGLLQRMQSGFTFIEVVLAIVLIGIILFPLLHLFSEITVTGARAATMPIATRLSQQLMEEIKSRKFDELAAKTGLGNWSSSLGPDVGEITSNKSTFDDIDDFNGWSQNFSPDYPQFSATVTVSYVASTNLSLPLIIPSPLPNNWTPSYKYVVVSVTGGGLTGPIQLVTVMTEVQSL